MTLFKVSASSVETSRIAVHLCGATALRSVLCAPTYSLTLHEGLQALGDVGLAQWYRSVGFRTLQGSLVLLAAHQAQHGSVQVLVLLLWGADEGLQTLGRGLL